MRYPEDQKERTRRRILEAAGRVFRRQGYKGGGVDAVMKEAGLTHGGFYAHFRNKEALLAAVVPHAMESMSLWRNLDAEGTGTEDDGTEKDLRWIRTVLRRYLSPQHQAMVEEGCPIPTLVSEIGRSGETSKASFAEALGSWRDQVAEHFGHLPAEERDEAALALILSCVGALSLARAVDDEALAEAVRRSARSTIERAYLPSNSDEPIPDPD